MSIAQNFPAIKPSLLLDFANTKKLDSRVTFARASEGRYYDGQTVAKAEENLLLASQIFNSSFWIKSNASVTVDSIAAPDGTTTADTFTATANNGYLLQSYTAPSSASYTFSIYVKRKTGTGNFDLSINNGVSYETKSVTADWTRVSITATGTVGSVVIRLATSGDEVYLWGAQLEQRSSVTAYTPTTTQPITNYIPVLQTASANIARFDHDPVTGESLGLLVEEQRTNLLTYSSEFDNAAWTKSNATVTANTVVAPDGTLTADKVIQTATTAFHYISQNKTGLATATYTLSFYAKPAELQYLNVITNNNINGLTSATIINLATGAIANPSSFNATSIAVGNGWYRYTFTGLSSGSYSINLYPNQTSTASSELGDGYSGIYIWGAQLEAGAFPTSYIPTTASQVTRSADAASMTGTNFSEWYRADEGGFYTEAKSDEVGSRRIFAVSDGTYSQRFSSYFGTASHFRGQNTASGFTLDLDAGTQSANVFGKVAVSYAIGAQAVSLNGDTVVSATNTRSMPLVDRLFIGADATNLNKLNGHIKKIAYYPLRLSNANLQALTGS